MDYDKVYYYIDDFRIIKKLHSRNHSTVYITENIEDSKTYSLEIFQTSKDIGKNEQYDLEREAVLFKYLKHPVISEFYGINFHSITDKNKISFSILSDYYSNGSLRDLLTKEQQKHFCGLTPTKKTILLLGISNAMSYLHKKNIIHRNLTPENIYLDSNFYPHIGGLFEKNFEKFDNDLMTQKMGNYVYMAPELFDEDYYDQKVDVYSFSILAYEIVTRKKPYSELGNVSAFKLIHRICGGQRPLFQENVNERIREIISRCWSPYPNERPSFDEIYSFLKEDFSLMNEIVDEKEINEYIEMLEKNDYESVDQYKRELIASDDFGEIFKMKNQNKNEFLNAKTFYVFFFLFDDYSEKEKIKLMIDLKISMQLNHPSICKIIKFYPFGFIGENHPVIYSEFQKKTVLYLT